jgi:hypothetical protein
MLVAAAVCPHPPLLVPELAAGAAAELDALRCACDRAVAALAAAGPDLVVVVGDGPTVAPFPGDAWGTLAPYGVDVPVGAGTGPPTLPLSLTLGRWLLDRAGVEVERLFFSVAADTSPQRCAELGAVLAERSARVGVLAMGDGSARRSLKGPGYLDERAEPLDEEVRRALGAADLDALGALDPDLCAELLVAGRAAWQVLAGAAAGLPWRGDVLHAAAPYGVTYLVATLLPAARPATS